MYQFQLLFNIFNPCNIPDQEHVSFHTYGDDSIEIIHQQFLDSDSDTTLDELKAEWHLMKYHIAQKKCKVPENTDGITLLEWCLTEIMKYKYERRDFLPIYSFKLYYFYYFEMFYE